MRFFCYFSLHEAVTIEWKPKATGHFTGYMYFTAFYTKSMITVETTMLLRN